MKTYFAAALVATVQAELTPENITELGTVGVFNQKRKLVFRVLSTPFIPFHPLLDQIFIHICNYAFQDNLTMAKQFPGN